MFRRNALKIIHPRDPYKSRLLQSDEVISARGCYPHSIESSKYCIDSYFTCLLRY
jgi:hypothetical protein